MTRDWSGRSHGGGIGHAVVHLFARSVGPAWCYALLIPPTCWYFLRDARARTAADAYWRRIRPDLGRGGRLVMTWVHFFTFAQILADRFLASVPHGRIRFRNPGAANLDAGMAHPQGCIILSAHVGAWDMAGRWLTVHPGRSIAIVMLRAEDPQVRQRLEWAMGAHPLTVIDLNDPFAASLEIAARLRRGETCCLLGDRTVGTDARTVRVPFLGGTAAFPTGPFLAAAITGACIVTTFAVKRDTSTYVLHADPPWTIPGHGRAGRSRAITDAVTRWAQRLEQVVRRYPTQWQNFYDFWRH